MLGFRRCILDLSPTRGHATHSGSQTVVARNCSFGNCGGASVATTVPFLAFLAILDILSLIMACFSHCSVLYRVTRRWGNHDFLSHEALGTDLQALILNKTGHYFGHSGVSTIYDTYTNRLIR
jgi:hypothetical protein